MDLNFAEKKAKILIVDSQSTIRQLFAETFRKAGFNEIFQVESLTDAIHILEAERIDWLVTSLFADSHINALQILRLAIEGKTHFYRTTLILDEAEFDCLDAAFEMGLFSYLKKPLTRDSIQNEVNSLLDAYERARWNPVLIATRYIHKWLHNKNKFSHASDLERAMLSQFPANPEVLLLLAETQTKLGQTSAATQAARMVKMIDPKYKAEADTFLTSTNEKEEKPDLGVFGISSVAVVIPDDALRATIKNALTSANVKRIDEFSDGLAAANFIKKSDDIHLIVQEWKLPTLAGHVFLQRVRQFKPVVPIVVMTDSVGDEDKILVMEMGVSDVFPTVPNDKAFIDKLLGVLLSSAMASDYAVQERKFRQALTAGNIDEANALKEKIFSDFTVTQGQRNYVDAELEFYLGNYGKAREQALDALRFGYENVLTLNLLAKALTKLGDLEFALKCFAKAHSMSPQNIERICNIAEVNSELNERTKASESLEAAKTIDDQNPVVQETEAKITITQGDAATSQSALESLDSLSGFFSFMNNKAVVLSKSGKARQAIELYKNVIAALKTRAPEELYVVYYNLALAEVKNNELRPALANLKVIIAHKHNRVFEKANALAKKIEEALSKGQNSVTLQTRQPTAPAANNSSTQERLTAVLQEHKVPMCCYGLYYGETTPSAKVRQLYANLPSFKTREAIKREEAMGAEKTLKMQNQKNSGK